MPTASQAIQRRLDLLQDQWTLFATDPKARLLRWVVAPDEVSLVQAFWDKESDERAAETPDLLLRLRSRFEDPEGHGLLLRAEFLEMLDKAEKALAEEGPRTRWTCPSPVSGASDLQALVAALEAFRAAHAPKGGVVGVWLDPEAVGDEGLYALWLQQLVKAAPGGCRFAVLDDRARPALEGLEGADPEQVHSAVADLDMSAAQEEISRQGGDLETPGGQFRHLFVRMSNAAKEQDVEGAVALADRAVAIAEEQKWHALAAAAHMAAGGVLATGQPQGARARYGLAEGLAIRAEEEGDAQSRRVRLAARLASGAVLISTGELAEAAAWYRETVPVAEAVEDARSVLDCWRLASYCYEQSGAVREAWETGLAGFEVGRKLDLEARKASTLPYLAEGLMRMTTRRPMRDQAQGMEELIVATLGRDWRPAAASAQQPVAGARGR